MKHYLERKLLPHIHSLSARLQSRYGLSLSIKSTHLLSLRNLRLCEITLKSNTDNAIVKIECAQCRLSLWQSLLGRWIVGEVVMRNLSADNSVVAKGLFTLSEIVVTFGANFKKATILVETNGITLTIRIKRTKANTQLLSELNINWNNYLSVMGNNLNFHFFRDFHSTTPVLFSSVLACNNHPNQPLYFNASMEADCFALTPAHDMEQTTSVIDKQFLLNTLFSKHGGNYFTKEAYVPYHTVPEPLIHAVICTEDPGFWTHRGVDPSFIGYALSANMKSKRFERGASTITMQLVRNLFLNHDKNILRKIEECVIALLLENYFKIEKKDILELYLNLIEFAPDVYGLHRASLFYFDKPYQELSLTESLVLTYIIPRPRHFYEALLTDSIQLKKNLHRHIQQYATAMLEKGLISQFDVDSISFAIAFAPIFGILHPINN